MLITSPFCPPMFEFVCMMMSSDVHSALLFAAWLPAAALAGGDVLLPGRDAASFGHRPHLTYWDRLLTYSVTQFGRPAAFSHLRISRFNPWVLSSGYLLIALLNESVIL